MLSLRFILITMGLKDLPNAEGPAHRRRDRNYTNILDPNSLFLLQTIIERVPPDGGRRGVIWKKVLCSKELRSVVSPVHLNSNRVKGFTHRRRDLQYRRHQHSKSQHPLPTFESCYSGYYWSFAAPFPCRHRYLLPTIPPTPPSPIIL